MTFDAIEISREGAQPVFYYQFTLGTTVWRYTSANVTQLLGGHTWLKAAISDDGVKYSGEATADALNIDAPTTIGPVQMAMTTPPSEAIQVAILHGHVGETEAVVVYSGQVKQINFMQPGQARIICETTSASMQRDGLRLPWQRGCPHSLYDPITCRVDKAAFAVTLRVLAIDGYNVTMTDTAHDDAWFAGGFIEWSDPVRGTLRRGVESDAADVFTMFGMTDDLYPGLSVIAYPGCSRTFQICGTKFDNQPNYGGIPNFPGKSPFDGTPVF